MKDEKKQIINQKLLLEEKGKNDVLSKKPTFMKAGMENKDKEEPKIEKQKTYKVYDDADEPERKPISNS